MLMILEKAKICTPARKSAHENVGNCKLIPNQVRSARERILKQLGDIRQRAGLALLHRLILFGSRELEDQRLERSDRKTRPLQIDRPFKGVDLWRKCPQT